MLLMRSQRNSTQIHKQRNLELGARRTATIPSYCDIGLEWRREQVAAKDGGTPCEVGRQKARSSFHIKRRSYVLSSL